MIEANLVERIAAVIDRRFAEQIETTMRLASIPNTRGAEGPPGSDRRSVEGARLQH